MKFLHEKIKSRRKELGLSQAQLADLIGMARQNLILIEGGKFHPNLKNMMRLAKTLGVELTYFFEDR